MVLNFFEYGSAKIYAFEDSVLKFWQFGLKNSKPRLEIKIESGAVRFKIFGTESRMRIEASTPNSYATPEGTDFAVSFDKDIQKSFFEIYDGKITVASNATAELKILSSSYRDSI